MKIRAAMGRQRDPLRPTQYQVDKVVEIPNTAFDHFMIKPLGWHDFIAGNRIEPYQGDGFDHCLLVLSDGGADGALIQCGDDGRAMCAAYVAGARDIVQARLDRAADFIVSQGTQRTASGSWYVYCEELDEKFDVAIQEGNGLDAMLRDTLECRPEVSQVEIALQHIETTFHPEFCEQLRGAKAERAPDTMHPRPEVADKGIPAEFSPVRAAQLLNNAVAAALGLYQGEDSYTMLHNSFGLTLQEIREHGYLSDLELCDICHVPRQVLEGGMRVRDVLHLDSVSEFASLAHKDSAVLVPLEDLEKLTASGKEDFAALLDAQVDDIRVDDGEPELVLKGIEAKELERFCDALEAHEQAEQAMGDMTP